MKTKAFAKLMFLLLLPAAPATAAVPEKSADAQKAEPERNRKLKSLEFTPAEQGGVSLTHVSFETLPIDQADRSRNLNEPEEDIRVAEKALPPGGRLIIHIAQPTIGGANTQYFTAIVFDADGQEVQRETGPDDIPTPPGTDDVYWRNLFIVELLESKQPITVRVVDTLMNKAYVFKMQ